MRKQDPFGGIATPSPIGRHRFYPLDFPRLWPRLIKQPSPQLCGRLRGDVRSTPRSFLHLSSSFANSLEHGRQTYSIPADVTIIWHRFTLPQLLQGRLTIACLLSPSIIFLTHQKLGERSVNRCLARHFFSNPRLDFQQTCGPESGTSRGRNCKVRNIVKEKNRQNLDFPKC